ncbi:MAG TPA: hypothetical protein DD435_06860 [Cyanobacteria bacterium UBA8530]|nr:hypothetical protein [Cyanobacteria bacterium UBA8530]
MNEIVGGAYPQLSLTTSAMGINMMDSSAASSLAMGLGGGVGGLGGLGGLSGLGGGGNSFSLMQTSFSLNQVLFDGFRTKDGLALASLGRDSADLDIYNAQQAVLSDTANAYLTTLRMEGLLEVSRTALKAAQGHLDQANDRQKAGVGTRFEVLQSQTQIANVKGQVSKARNAAEMSRLFLFNTINVPPRVARLETAPELPEVRFDAKKIEPAVNNRPEMRQLSLKRDVDLRTIDLNTRAYLPTVAAIGSYSMQGAGTGRYWLAGVSAQWNILDGGKTKSKIAQSQSDVARDDALLEQTRSRLALDVQKSIQDRDEARERLTIADEGLAFARESFRLSEVRYRSGVGTGLEVIDSQSALTQAEQNRIGAFYDLQTAELKFARSLGIDLRDYLRGTK